MENSCKIRPSKKRKNREDTGINFEIKDFNSPSQPYDKTPFEIDS